MRAAFVEFRLFGCMCYFTFLFAHFCQGDLAGGINAVGAVQELLGDVVSRLETTVKATRLPAWGPAAAAASAQVRTFSAARFGRALRVMRSVAAFEGVLARGVLHSLALDSLLSRQVRSSPLLDV